MKKFLLKLFILSARYQLYLWLGIIAVSCIAGWFAVRNHYSADMCRLLPENSRSYRDLKAVLNSGLAGRITLYVVRKDGKELDNAADTDTLKKLARKLKKIKGIDHVISAPTGSSQEEIYRDFVRYFPGLYPPSQLPRGKELDSCLRQRFKSLCLNPLGGALQFRYDPCGWTTQYLLKLENILKISGLRFYSGNTSFIFSPDRKVCMMMLYTSVPAADYQASSQLISALQKVSDALPSHLRCEFFSPHIHMLQNAKIIKTDLHIFALCTLFLFAILFAFIYKCDWRGVLIPLLAGTGSLWAAAIMGVVFTPVFLFTLAMGGVLIGIAGDYGIHLYAAGFADRKVQSGIELVPKLLLAFFTTSLAFLVFVFSGVPAFVQFGTYSVLTLLCSFLLLLTVLPGVLFFRSIPRKMLDFFQLLHLQNVSVKHIRLPLIVLLLLICGSFIAKFDTDIRKFDIAHEKSKQDESVYQRSFTRQGYPFVLLLSSDTFKGLLNKCQEEKKNLLAKNPGIKLISPSDFFIAPEKQKENLQLWQEYISSGKWSSYKKDFLKKASVYGFAEEFFSGFFNSIEKNTKVSPNHYPQMLEFTYLSMIGRTSHWTGIIMADKNTVSAEALQKSTSAVILTENIFKKQIFKDIVGNLPQMIPWVILIIFASLIINLRSLSRACLAFVPVVTCLLSIAGIHGLLGQEMTLAVVVAGCITVGIAVDYGLLLVNSEMDRHIFNSIAFSALTTAFGGLTVFFTQHPMLRAAGLTIVTGILSSCLFSFFLLAPLLKKLRTVKISGKVPFCMLLILSLAGTGCSSIPRDSVLPLLPVPAELQCRFPESTVKEFQGSLLMDYRCGQVSFLIAGKLSPDGKGEFFGFSPGGMRIFSLSGRGYELENFKWLKAVVPEKRQEELSRFLYRAVSSLLYVPLAPQRIVQTRTPQKGVILSGKYRNGETLDCFYSGNQGEIVRKKYQKKNFFWLVEYCRPMPGTDCVYLYSDKSFLQAGIKLKFYE